jgi:hypothetical protein
MDSGSMGAGMLTINPGHRKAPGMNRVRVDADHVFDGLLYAQRQHPRKPIHIKGWGPYIEGIRYSEQVSVQSDMLMI